MKQFTYLLVDIGCILVPFLFSFYKPRPFYKEWTYFFPANLIVALFFLIWDYYFTEIGVWGFNPQYLTGIYLGNLPIEEVLFFICIPYSCVFTWFALEYLLPANPLTPFQKPISFGLIIILGGIGITHLNHWYTASAFLLLAVFLIWLVKKRADLSMDYLAYLVILPFFFASNGLLTGSFIESPIVWYNDSENLSLRMGTIPVEDTFYGLLLILMNLQLYKWFKSQWSAKNTF